MTQIVPRMKARVFGEDGREILLDGRNAIVPDGGCVRLPVLLIDLANKGDIPVVASSYLVDIDGRTMSKDAAVRELQARLADAERRAEGFEGQLAAMDAVHAPNQPQHDPVKAAYLETGRQMRAQIIAENLRRAALQRGEVAPQTPAEQYARALSNAWKDRGAAFNGR